MSKHTLGAAALPLLLFVAACGSSDSSGATTDGDAVSSPVAAEASSSAEEEEDTTEPDASAGTDVDADTDVDPGTADTADTAATATGCAGIAANFVTAGSANADLADPEVAATCDGDEVVITANGIPDYTYIQTSPGDPRAADLEFVIPAEPEPAAEPTDVPLLGAAAVAVNGVPIYGPTEGTGGDVLSLGGALSDCGSHNGPTGFHIHMFGTSTTTDCMFTPEEVAAEPQLFGYAFDGYPIYTGNDQYESSWQLTDESLFATDTWAAHTYVEGSGDLDECNGRVDDDGNYAYFTTDTFPYVIGCYSGVVDLETSGAGGAGGEGGPPQR